MGFCFETIVSNAEFGALVRWVTIGPLFEHLHNPHPCLLQIILSEDEVKNSLFTLSLRGRHMLCWAPYNTTSALITQR